MSVRPRRGEIYFVNLNPTAGHEQSGVRPVLVLSIDEINDAPLVVTVIIGTKGSNVRRDFATNVRVDAVESGLPTETVFLCFQLRSIDVSRFPQSPAGKLAFDVMEKIEVTVRYCMGL